MSSDYSVRRKVFSSIWCSYTPARIGKVPHHSVLNHPFGVVGPAQPEGLPKTEKRKKTDAVSVTGTTEPR
jgi:hypothetical protein